MSEKKKSGNLGLELVIEIPEGATDDEIIEMTGEAIVRADRIHRSIGGSGFKIESLKIAARASLTNTEIDDAKPKSQNPSVTYGPETDDAASRVMEHRAEVFREAYFKSIAVSKDFYSRSFALKFAPGSSVDVADLAKDASDVGYRAMINELRWAADSGLITESAFREVTGREL